ncbi:MAG: VWA domain-containing protein, partial [Betaproteobacteria bacterium]
MLIEFFLKLKQGGVPVSIKEFLVLLQGFEKQLIFGSVEDFYHLARTCLVKDEKYFDRYDRVFSAYFKGIVDADAIQAQIPEEWLRKLANLRNHSSG